MHAEMTQRALWAIAAAGLVLVLAGCGGDGRTCGAGTKAVDGKCVAEPPLQCGAGTVAVGGACVLEDAGAADGSGGGGDSSGDSGGDSGGGSDGDSGGGGDGGDPVGCAPACAVGQVCNGGVCEDPAYPAGWLCAAASYADGMTCHCACGAPDPDCNDASLPVKHCPSGACTKDGLCAACKPACDGKNCGPDGCGALCGLCNDADKPVCQGGMCVSTCVPACEGKTCGSDGCGGNCGGCASDETCALGQCVAIAADASCAGSCGGKAPSGCGCDATCKALGTCCADFVNVCACIPACAGNVCGPDGCGGVCGTCAAGDVCGQGACLDDPCQPDPCSGNGTCAPATGACACKPGFGGPNCKACAAGFTGYPNCIQDLCAGKDVKCSGNGTCAPASGTCDCAPGFAGVACETCAAGMGTWPTCQDPCASKPNCDDGNACTADSCHKVQGCVHALTILACEDGNPCTANDLCQAGACVAGGKVCDLGVNSADDASDGACDAKHCSLREAILAANAGNKAASIGFGVAGPIVLAGALPAASVALTIQAAGATVTIDAGGKARIFHAKTDLVLTNLVLKGGDGGTTGGGAVWMQAGALTMSHVQVFGATATGSGAGVRAHGDVALSQCAFGDNKLQGADATGAALHVEGLGTISRTVFAANQAEGPGGALSCGSACSLTIVRSGFVGNSASHGGALYIQGSAVLANTTLVGNTATITGGAVSAPGKLEAIHVTVAGNSAPNIAGIVATGSLALRNCVVGDSLGGGADCAATKLTATVHTLVADGSCNALYKGPILLGPLAAGCDLLPQRAPLAGSKALDAGDAATCAAVPAAGVDQCGAPRPVGKGCDLGALEVAGP